MKTYLISGRKKSDQHSATATVCNCCQAGLGGPEQGGGAGPGCTSPRSHSPDGGPAACTLPLERATVGGCICPYALRPQLDSFRHRF
ncbi:hypothetical protein NHX12_032669 [Muraenolepis orangiensis]|uniref:Uncharacterized protein n=1 Tax=Muraenolepis orangiensis TaxID=630683 RepID=A0A9Q0E629_9TELE|nr:hypothetical protein NHX12_032669 [Muraenolepis orangiensis]